MPLRALAVLPLRPLGAGRAGRAGALGVVGLAGVLGLAGVVGLPPRGLDAFAEGVCVAAPRCGRDGASVGRFGPGPALDPNPDLDPGTGRRVPEPARSAGRADVVEARPLPWDG